MSHLLLQLFKYIPKMEGTYWERQTLGICIKCSQKHLVWFAVPSTFITTEFYAFFSCNLAYFYIRTYLKFNFHKLPAWCNMFNQHLPNRFVESTNLHISFIYTFEISVIDSSLHYLLKHILWVHSWLEKIKYVYHTIKMKS